MDLIDLVDGAREVLTDHWNSVNQIPDSDWIYKKPIDISIRGKKYEFTFPPGAYGFYIKNTNPAPLSHPEFTLTIPNSTSIVQKDKIALRNTASAREYQTEFVISSKTVVTLDISCHTAVSGLFRIGRCHALLGFVKLLKD